MVTIGLPPCFDPILLSHSPAVFAGENRLGSAIIDAETSPARRLGIDRFGHRNYSTR
ncbi:hypothetical protein HSEST_1345 [Halapricum desulfuricans]|uniref:Uncharacterized protein n=1 Tax=Halapricum desulfuricans TaxID=2841257 RepID=A0A897NPZ4_9EURY|nr:hypothetical protein HSEST_1345 [Halapricum desulfuricans]